MYNGQMKRYMQNFLYITKKEIKLVTAVKEVLSTESNWNINNESWQNMSSPKE